jgi:hypothetical protein
VDRIGFKNFYEDIDSTQNVEDSLLKRFLLWARHRELEKYGKSNILTKAAT